MTVSAQEPIDVYGGVFVNIPCALWPAASDTAYIAISNLTGYTLRVGTTNGTYWLTANVADLYVPAGAPISVITTDAPAGSLVGTILLTYYSTGENPTGYPTPLSYAGAPTQVTASVDDPDTSTFAYETIITLLPTGLIMFATGPSVIRSMELSTSLGSISGSGYVELHIQGGSSNGCYLKMMLNTGGSSLTKSFPRGIVCNEQLQLQVASLAGSAITGINCGVVFNCTGK